MRELSHQLGYDILHVSNDDLIPVSEMDYEDNQKLVIFDDFFCERNQRKLVDYFIQGRHKNCSVIYLSQSFYKTTVYSNFHPRESQTEYHLSWELIKNIIKQQLENRIHFCLLINQ